jgi:2-amino-4-hydroxy-6-hydroxymethyldihydropteridine diphosphokinase
MPIAYLSLGSNVGNREGNIARAIAALTGVTRVSRYYETEPADVPGQPWFLNCVVEVQTDLVPLDLLHATQSIEQALGRVREIPRGPRTLDIDILFYGETMMTTPELTIPHPRLAGRRFVLEPLCEIAPAVRDPRTGRSVRELLAALTDPLIVRKAS